MRMLMTAAMIAALIAAPLTAGTFQFKKAQVEITSPEGWKSAESEGSVTFTAPDDSIACVFLAVPAKNFEEAAKLLDKEAEKGVGEIDWEEKPENIEINGMATELWDGTAKEGKMVVEAAYMDTPSGEQILCLYWFSAKDAATKHEKAIDEMVKGIKPMKE
jgi:hypothetical protein